MQLTILDKTNFIFSVQACKSVHIALSSIPGVTDALTYEILLGGLTNNVVEIKDGVQGNVVASHNEDGILSCSESRQFWLSWEHGRLAVGKGGQVDVDQFIYKDNVNIAFTSVTMSTVTGVSGLWQYERTLAPLPSKYSYFLLYIPRGAHGIF